jgi:CMP-N-acetylneuraminic acid synthetase
MHPKIVALVPMRHNSERVKGKNYRDLGGMPLYHHIVRSLSDCPLIDTILIDTDSPFILRDCPRQFPHVLLAERPEHLRDGCISMNEVLLHDVGLVEADFYLQTHSTNPLLRSETITTALETLLAAHPKRDSLFTVTRLQTRLWDAQGRPVNHDPDVLLRTQDLPPMYEENSNLYVFTARTLRERKNRLGERPLMFEIDAKEAWDIDEELDFSIAEFLYLQRQKEALAA